LKSTAHCGYKYFISAFTPVLDMRPFLLKARY